MVNQKHYSFDEEKQHGILDLEAYTDEDWECYGDNIALTNVDSEEWREWISANWDEELFRRRMNYTLTAYKEDGNILWFMNSDWSFDRAQYEEMVKHYWEQETLEDLANIAKSEMTFDDCIAMIKKLNINGCDELFEHKKLYDEVLLHILQVSR